MSTAFISSNPNPLIQLKPRGLRQHQVRRTGLQPPRASLFRSRAFKHATLVAAAFCLQTNPKAYATPVLNANTTHLESISHQVLSKSNSTNVHSAIRVRNSLAAVPQHAPITITDRIAFYFGEFLMWNPAARVIAMLVFTLLAMYLGSFLYRLADPEKKEAQSPFWHSVRAIANPLEDDWENNSLRTTSIALAAIGMVVFAILVGMVTESVESAVHNVDGDRARVVVNDHILVCGWGGHVAQMLKDVNQVGNKVKVVVLAKPELRETMMESMREALDNSNGKQHMRIFYRSGAPFISEDLNRVGAERASKIILVNSRDGGLLNADRKVLSRAMALKQNLPGFKGDIVAELNNTKDEALLKHILNKGNARSVEVVNVEASISRFMAQVVRQPGLADVVNLMMGDNTANVFHVEKAGNMAPKLVGKPIRDLNPTAVDGAIICGVFDKTGSFKIGFQNTPSQMDVVTKDTDILFLGVPVPTKATRPVALKSEARELVQLGSKMDSEYGFKELKKPVENYLVCGWRKEMGSMLTELDRIVARGSTVTIIDESAPKNIKNLRNIRVKVVSERPDSYSTLEPLFSPRSRRFDHVILLGPSPDDRVKADTVGSSQEDDTRNLACLAYVSELLTTQSGSLSKENQSDANVTRVTAEFNTERVAQMARDQNEATNTILPLNLSAKISAQTVRDNRLNSVWKELLSQEGHEVYLRPCSQLTTPLSSLTSFQSLAEKLSSSNSDVVIGYVTKDGNVVINPVGEDRYEMRTWSNGEKLIVLSED